MSTLWVQIVCSKAGFQLFLCRNHHLIRDFTNENATHNFHQKHIILYYNHYNHIIHIFTDLYLSLQYAKTSLLTYPNITFAGTLANLPLEENTAAIIRNEQSLVTLQYFTNASILPLIIFADNLLFCYICTSFKTFLLFFVQERRLWEYSYSYHNFQVTQLCFKVKWKITNPKSSLKTTRNPS